MSLEVEVLRASTCFATDSLSFVWASGNIQIKAIPSSWAPDWKWREAEPSHHGYGAQWARNKCCYRSLTLSSPMLLQHKLTHPGWSKWMICIFKAGPCICVNPFSLCLCFYSRFDLFPRRHWQMSGDILGCQFWGCYWPLVDREHKRC